MLSTNTVSTKVKMAFVSDHYNWDSYSIVRSLYEELDRREEVELRHVWEDIVEEDTTIVLLVGTNARLLNRQSHVKVIRIGLSDPNLYPAGGSDLEYDIYITNDFSIAEAYGHYYLPCFSDSNYFKPIEGIKKETDILFVGVKDHPYVAHREDWVKELGRAGFNIKCFGHGWDNGFIKGDRLIEEYNKAHICLDLGGLNTALSSRIFQSSMSGTPVITRYRQEINQMFPNRSDEILVYSDYKGLLNTLKIVLSETAHNENVLSDMGISARERCLERHDVSNRVDDLLEMIND